MQSKHTQTLSESTFNMITNAVFSDCGLYRYSLTRRWNKHLPQCIFIGLNPSTADLIHDDPTVRRLIGFAKGFGYGGFDLLNIFALRATDPRKLKRHSNPVGPKNNRCLVEAADSDQIVIACWGTNGNIYDRGEFVSRLFDELHCLGVNQDCSPKHPLYLRKATALRKYYA